MATIHVDLDTIEATTSKALEAHLAKPWIASCVAQAVRVAEAHSNKMGYFTEQIARAGYIAIGMTNAKACVSPPGDTKAVHGTNPTHISA